MHCAAYTIRIVPYCSTSRFSLTYPIALSRRPGSNHAIELLRITIAEQGRGFGRAALRLVKLAAFELLGAHRLSLDVRGHNARAQRLYDSEGFVREGVLRDYNKAGDRFESLIIMSILEGEYRG